MDRRNVTATSTQTQTEPTRHLFKLRKSAKILLRLSFILPWMQQTLAFFIRVSSARPKYSTHAQVLRRRRQSVTARLGGGGRTPSSLHPPEEDQVLLVLVLPQKSHQVVELVLRPADLPEQDQPIVSRPQGNETHPADSRCSSWRVWRGFSGRQRRPRPSP